MAFMIAKPDDKAMIEAFDTQIGWCHKLGSPFTAAVLQAVKTDIEAGGTWAQLLQDRPSHPLADAMALRCSGALHALVLTGKAPALAALYPPKAETGPALADAITQAANAQENFIREFLESPPQTNEVGRSSVLLGGFLEVARVTGLPLATLEIGASAGLNLNWDRFHYQIGDKRWGDANSPVRLQPEWKGALPPLEAPLSVVARAGCDVAPIDIRREENRTLLKSYAWPDQTERLERLDAAIGLALAQDVRVEKQDAKVWLEKTLKQRLQGAATVIYHSIMWQYMPKETRDGINALIEEEGRNASKDAPLAWLRFEPDAAAQTNVLTLSLWPGPTNKQLAKAHPHGAWVEWLA